MRPTRDATMMRIAGVIAERSTCLRRGVGAVAVDALGRILAVGHNGVPMGQAHCADMPCVGVGLVSGTGLDLCQAVHAEINMLLFCQDVMRIDTVYVTASPCSQCLRALLNTGCRRIVYGEVYLQAALEWWAMNGRIAERMTA